MIKRIYLAGGCFWGTEHFLKLLKGVKRTEVGYANGVTPNPTYKEVCTGETLHAETVLVEYDPQEVSLGKILNMFFKTIDPTSLNKQGGDIGTQYRTGIYYIESIDVITIDSELNKLEQNYEDPLVVEVKPIECFYSAEEYHQDYLNKNPEGYCHISPELFTIAKEA